MKEQKNSLAQKAFVISGSCLILAAIVMLIFWQRNINASQQKSKGYVDTILTLIPKAQDAFPAERRDNTMPVLSIENIDFVGILEMPRYNSTLPVGAKWGESNDYPCKLDGSIYDGTMQIGTTNLKGQYDFYRDISVGDKVLFTDMEGNRYTFAVTDLRYEDHADQDTLNKKEASLTLFVKNMYAFEYLIVYCNIMK